MNRYRLAAALLAVAAATTLAATPPAWAGTKGRSTRTQAVSSGSWGAAGADVGGSPTPGTPYVIQWALITLLPTSQYFQVVNTGSLDLTGQTYTATRSSGPTVELTACVGATWSGSSCGGSQVSLGTTSSGATTVSIAIPAGSSLSVRARTTGLLSLGTFTTSITITTTRSQVRASITKNS